VRQDLKALAAVLDRAPHEFAVLLDALAVRREYLNLEKCFLRARHAEDAHGTGQGAMAWACFGMSASGCILKP